MIIGKGENSIFSNYVINDKKIGNICIYNNNHCINTYCGWFENIRGERIAAIDIPANRIVNKRKINMEKEDVFIVTNDMSKTLFIPAKMINLKLNKYRYINQSIMASYRGEFNIYIEDQVCYLGDNLIDIDERYTDMVKKCSVWKMKHNTADNIVKNLNILKDLAKEYHAEKQLLESLNTEQAIELAKKRGIWTEKL